MPAAQIDHEKRAGSDYQALDDKRTTTARYAERQRYKSTN
jgi:hypothetical protein